MSTIVKTQGIKKLYAGAVGNILRGAGTSMILVIYDDLKDFFMLHFVGGQEEED